MAGALGVCLHAAGDVATQGFARGLGATWAGGSDEMPPEPLDAAIIFATVGDLVPLALKAVRKGGRVVCAGIHMSDIPSFPYQILWEERAACVGRQSHTARWNRFPAPGARRLASSLRPRAIRSNKPTRPSRIFVPAGSRALRFSCPEDGQTVRPLLP